LTIKVDRLARTNPPGLFRIEATEGFGSGVLVL